MRASGRRLQRRGERGAITWVTALLLLALASAVYLAVVWVPVYLVHYEVKQVVRDFGNQAVKNPGDAELVAAMCEKLRILHQVTVPGEDGQPQRRPAVEVSPQEVTWERDTSGAEPTLRVAFPYRRDVHYPLLDRWTEVPMSVDLVMNVAQPNWGPAR